MYLNSLDQTGLDRLMICCGDFDLPEAVYDRGTGCRFADRDFCRSISRLSSRR